MNSLEILNVPSIQSMKNVSAIMISNTQSSTKEAINWLRYVDKLIRMKGDKRIECELDLIIGILNKKMRVE